MFSVVTGIFSLSLFYCILLPYFFLLLLAHVYEIKITDKSWQPANTFVSAQRPKVLDDALHRYEQELSTPTEMSMILLCEL